MKLAVRSLGRSPGLSAIAIVAFALGIGLTTATFSILDGVVLKGLPIEKANELIHIEESNLPAGINSVAVPIHDFLDWRAAQRSFTDLAAFYEGTVNLAGPGARADRYSGAFTTANLFDLARVRPQLGRTLTADDERPGAPGVVVIGSDVWENRFAGDRDIIGRTIRVNGEQSTIVGVMPKGFEFPVRQDVWVPLRMNALEIPRGEGERLEVFGRLRDGRTMDQAYAEIATIAKSLEARYPKSNAGVLPLLKPYTQEFVTKDELVLFYTMFVAVLGVLLIACANVANLLLARAVVRSREVAIRSALGATRRRILGQFLVEAVLLSVAGGALGLGIGFAGIAFFNDAMKSAIEIPFWIKVDMNPVVVLFTVGVTTLASVLAGVLPALQASGVSIGDVLKDEGRGSSSFRLARFSRGLVVAEVALSCALLVAAGMSVKSIVVLNRTTFGVTTASTFTARLDLPASTYPDAPKRLQFYEELTRRLSAEPNVKSIAMTTSLPLSPSSGTEYAVEGERYANDRDLPYARTARVTPEFFQTFGIAVRQGRAFTAADREGTVPVAIVNASFVRRHFATADPLGRRFRVGDATAPWVTIVGVAVDAHMNGVRDAENGAGFYVPISQNVPTTLSIAIPTRDANPLALTGRVREIVAALDADIPTYDVRTMDQVVALSTWFYGTFGTLFSAFGIAALFLAAIGLYGVMAFSVGRRTQEMGVRLALGARPSDVLRLVLKQGLIQLGIGLGIGLALALLLARGLQLVLFGVGPADPVVLVAVVVVLAASGIIACLIPARRATRGDPMTAMRST
ncbi:MAG TPA: ABC transporter permease [Gemmatimonadaceae bacterium]|nr:ABC transporter permease [Gemmatimonadaceae bacterium]